MPVASTAAARSIRRAPAGTSHCSTVQVPPRLGPTPHIALVERCTAGARATRGLSPDSAMFRRIFLSARIVVAAMDTPQLKRF